MVLHTSCKFHLPSQLPTSFKKQIQCSLKKNFEQVWTHMETKTDCNVHFLWCWFPDCITSLFLVLQSSQMFGSAWKNKGRLEITSKKVTDIAVSWGQRGHTGVVTELLRGCWQNHVAPSSVSNMVTFDFCNQGVETLQSTVIQMTVTEMFTASNQAGQQLVWQLGQRWWYVISACLYRYWTNVMTVADKKHQSGQKSHGQVMVVVRVIMLMKPNSKNKRELGSALRFLPS